MVKPDPQTTKTHMTWERDVTTGDFVFSGRVTNHDLALVELDALDRRVIFSPKYNASDVAQSLEIIFRRMEEECKNREYHTEMEATCLDEIRR